MRLVSDELIIARRSRINARPIKKIKSGTILWCGQPHMFLPSIIFFGWNWSSSGEV